MMQSDDDVGKIATVTPVLVAKALECMMEHVLREAADVAHDRGTKTVTPQHLKQCVSSNDAFDFLRTTLAAVPALEEDKGDGKASRSSKPRTARQRSSAGCPPVPGASPARLQRTATPNAKRPRSPVETGSAHDASLPGTDDEAMPMASALKRSRSDDSEDQAAGPNIALPHQSPAVTQPGANQGTSGSMEADDDEDENYDEDDDDCEAGVAKRASTADAQGAITSLASEDQGFLPTTGIEEAPVPQYAGRGPVPASNNELPAIESVKNWNVADSPPANHPNPMFPDRHHPLPLMELAPQDFSKPVTEQAGTNGFDTLVATSSSSQPLLSLPHLPEALEATASRHAFPIPTGTFAASASAPEQSEHKASERVSVHALLS